MLLLTTLAVLGSLLNQASAQTPDAFEPSTTVNLPLTYGTTSITPGQAIALTVPAREPTLTLPAGLPTNASYLLNMVDPDAPTPDAPNPALAQVLHWLQADITFSAAGTATYGRAGPDPYFAPAPPSAAKHRYIFLLFKQPTATFAWPAGWEGYGAPNNGNRTAWDAEEFATAAGLGEPVAGTYFLAGR